MKYLKLFEKIHRSDENRLKLFCEEYLVYLLDDDFKLLFHPQSYDKVNIVIKRKDKIPFEWDDISSDFIPLIESLSEQKKGGNLKFKLSNWNTTKKHVLIMCFYDKTDHTKGCSGLVYDYNFILNDDISDRHKHNIREISFTVKMLKD